MMIKLNFAENLLIGEDEKDAIIFEGENLTKKIISWGELRNQVSVFAQALQADGIKEGDSEAWIAYIGEEKSPDFGTIFGDLNLEELDIRPAFELGDSQRSGIEEAKDSFAYLGQIHIADLS